MSVVREYYRRQKAEGNSPAKATLLIPAKVLKLLLPKPRRRSQGNVITGFSKFKLPLLASYSRSGTNWVRYFIETCSDRPTPGQTRRVAGSDYIVDRAHRAYVVMSKYPMVVLLVRDYRECLLRHHKERWQSTQDVTSFLEDSTVPQPCLWYIENIRAFDEFDQEKLLVYYEDLVRAPEREFVRLGEFLKLPEKRVSEFIDRLEENFAASVSAYTAGGHTSETTKTRSMTAHADSLLTESQRSEFDAYFKTRYPDLAQKYLNRYFS